MVRPWWQGCTIYQVYVRSFSDTDDDGYGDLPGVTDRLEYLAWLGVDALWLSPTMPSPDRDWGYDVADYYDVHPELGTMADLDRLVATAETRGIRVLLDLVPNHTSSEHAWFVEARSDGRARRRDWYVWADPVAGGPPNNWRDATGASAWTLDRSSGQYYLHNFLEWQPDLNWWNPEVHEEFLRIIRFWLERGVAGFRIDVAHGLYKDDQLRDDPPAPPGIGAPYGVQGVYSKYRPETHGVYREWRRLADDYSSQPVLLGETWVLDPAVMADYYGLGDELHLALNFGFLFSDFTADGLRSMVERTIDALPPGACPVWAGSNHDDSRFPTRWCGDDEQRIRLALTVLCTLPGTTVLYYGDELGLGDVLVPDEFQRDEMTWHGRAVRVNRDVARTPMPWQPGPGLGFTTAGVTPWLPFGPREGSTVSEQRADPESVLALTRTLLSLKGESLEYRSLAGPPQTWVYRSGRLTVAGNFSSECRTVEVTDGTRMLSSRTATFREAPSRVDLGPWEAVVSVQDLPV